MTDTCFSMMTRRQRIVLTAGLATSLCLLAAPLLAKPQSTEDCVACHTAESLPETHPPMADMPTEVCKTCHAVEEADGEAEDQG